MNEEQLEDLFHFYGYEDLYKRFKTPLYVTGIMDDADTELLEDFFEDFSFDEPVLFDEFRFTRFLSVRLILYKKNCFLHETENSFL